MVSRWCTVLSECSRLYFEKLHDSGEGSFFVENENGDKFEVKLDGWCGPYVVVGEEYLSKYWTIKPEGIGWTFIVNAENSTLFNTYLSDMSYEDRQEYRHFVISTLDTCIEILSRRAPVVKRIGTVNTVA